MEAVLNLLGEHSVLLIFSLLAIGTALGNIRMWGVQAGPAFVLFSALGVAALATVKGVHIAIPEVVSTLGLALFTYTVGVLNGSSFFATLRSGWFTMVGVAAVLCVSAGVAAGVGGALGLSPAMVAGSFAGAVTNTPALAAAIDSSGDGAGPVIGYSITYVFGVIGMLICASWALRSRAGDAAPSLTLTNLTIRVDAAAVRMSDLQAAYRGGIAFSRVRHLESPAVEVAGRDTVLRPGDLVTVVGPDDLVERVAGELGHPSSHSLLTDQRYLDARRITLSRRCFAGHTVADLGLEERFGATVTRARRGDSDLLATSDLRLQPGDWLKVVAPNGRMDEISAYLGDSARGAADMNPVGLGIGMALGVLLGVVHIPLPGGGLSLGAAAGTLIVGLVFGRLGRVGRLITAMPVGAASTLSQFGMLLFLACAGTKAGSLFVEALTSGRGAKVALVGVAVTSVSGLGVLILGRLLKGVEGTRLAGMMAGAQTQPAVLAFANERSGHDSRVAMGYALVYPVAMITKILLAQVLGSM